MRLLLFACSAEEAQLMMIYSDRMEITYLPSYDLKEIRDEIERCMPTLILCEANAFLNALLARPFGASPDPKQNEGPTTTEAKKPPITRREMRIMTLLAKGHTNDEIAKALHLSSRTVKRILSGLFERMQVANRTQLAGRIAELSPLDDEN